MDYDAQADELKCRCLRCSYRWTEKTVDQLPADAEPVPLKRVIAAAIVFVLIVVGATLLAGTGGHS
jgi:hypothetical protein